MSRRASDQPDLSLVPQSPSLSFRLVSVHEFCQANPQFRPGTIRKLIFHEKENGFDRVVVRLGRRVFLRLDEFERWLLAQQGREGR